MQKFKLKFIENSNIKYENKDVREDHKNPGDDFIHIFMSQDDIYLFEAYSTGDYEESCFAVTPETYEYITGKSPYIEICGETEFISENPFYEGMASLYVYEMIKNPLFMDMEIELEHLLKRDGKIMIFLHKKNNIRRRINDVNC